MKKNIFFIFLFGVILSQQIPYGKPFYNDVKIKDKINIEADLASKSAIEKLEKIGGSIQLKK